MGNMTQITGRSINRATLRSRAYKLSTKQLLAICCASFCFLFALFLFFQLLFFANFAHAEEGMELEVVDAAAMPGPTPMAIAPSKFNLPRLGELLKELDKYKEQLLICREEGGGQQGGGQPGGGQTTGGGGVQTGGGQTTGGSGGGVQTGGGGGKP